MGIVIGIDEAGLGPNLGPFVVTATVWEVPGPPATFEFWSAMSGVVSSDAQSSHGRVVIADSKALFQPHQGLARLERGALAILVAANIACDSLDALCAALQPGNDWSASPWYQDAQLTLPSDSLAADVQHDARQLRDAPARLRGVVSRMVEPSEFNQLLATGNKAEVVTCCHLELLRGVCRGVVDEDILVYSDKHGGRNRYAGALTSTWDGAWVEIVRESADLSVYRIGRTEFRFEPRAERHLPVAAASMIAKYLREQHMRLFNEFWRRLIPELAPTQGYPLDARRFAAAIETTRERLGIAHELLWRRK